MLKWLKKKGEITMEMSKIKKWIIVGVTVCVAVFLVLVFGGRKPEKMIIGQWEEEGGGEALIFEEDGTVTVDGIPATYYIDDEKVLHIKALGLFSAAEMEWDKSMENDDGWFVNRSTLKLGDDIYKKK